MSASFWQTVAIYCSNFGPVASPLISAAGNAAAALHNAECECRRTEADIEFFNGLLAQGDE